MHLYMEQHIHMFANKRPYILFGELLLALLIHRRTKTVSLVLEYLNDKEETKRRQQSYGKYTHTLTLMLQSIFNKIRIHTKDSTAHIHTHSHIHT